MVSADCLRRGTFPHERSAAHDFELYSAELLILEREAFGNTALLDRIRRLRLQISGDFRETDGVCPRWLGTLDQLSHASTNVPTRLSTAIEQLDYAKHPFASCFSNLLTHELYELEENVSLNLYCKDSNVCLVVLAQWLLSGLEQVSKYVLYVVYTESELSYSSWVGAFRGCAADESPWQRIAENYPVLIRLLHSVVTHRTEALRTLFLRLSTDRQAIKASLGVDPFAKLEALKIGLSDPHRGGHSVAVLDFGHQGTLVYKPKDLRVDAAFAEFIRGREHILGMRSISVLQMEGYGWTSYVEDAGRSFTDGDDPYAIGRAAATLWLCNATDFHSENIACKPDGNYPLDVETLMAPMNRSGSDAAWRAHSIYSTLLFQFEEGEGSRQDLSGFNPLAAIANENNEVHFRVKKNRLQFIKLDSAASKQNTGKRNRRYDTRQLEAIQSAFSSLCRSSIPREIAEFASKLDDNCRLRVVFRNTALYFRLLDRMCQPRYLRDAALLHLDLMRMHLSVEANSPYCDNLHRIVDDEIRQLCEGDIPYFSVEAGNNSIGLFRGEINEFFDTTCKALCQQKISEFEGSDVQEQLDLINLAVNRTPVSISGGLRLYRHSDLTSALNRFLRSAMSSAFTPRSHPSRWLSFSGDVASRRSVAQVGSTDYYSGSWGILLAIEAVLSVSSSRTLVSEVHAFLDREAEQWSRVLNLMHEGGGSKILQPLGFAGVGGEFIAQSSLLRLNGTRWGFLAQHLNAMIRRLEDTILLSRSYDVIEGASGLILGLDHLIGQLDDGLEQSLRRCQARAARTVITASSTYEEGAAWCNTGERVPLLSFSHGWAGAVAALSRLDRKPNNGLESYSQIPFLRKTVAFAEALAQRDALFFDYRRIHSSTPELNRSWCHGYAGVLRGLRAVSEYSSPKLVSTVDETLEHLLRQKPDPDCYRFCCGEFGVLDLALDTDRYSEKQGVRMAERIIGCIRSESSTETFEFACPGLFQGYGGMAYTLARTINRDLVSLSGVRSFS